MRVLASLLVAVVLAAAPTRSQQTVSLSGTVVDPAGTPIPGVALELRRDAAVVLRTTSDQKGAWIFQRVTPGAYEIRATVAGFNTSIVRVTVGERGAPLLTIKLRVGALTETVTVTVGTPDPDALGAGSGGGRGGVPAGVIGGVVGGLPNAPTPPSAAPRGVAPTQMSRHLYVGPPAETATYASVEENRFRSVTEHPLSTFSIDVDTASYANVRRFLNDGRLPPVDAVRIEEMINYFKYDYPDPRGDAPVSISTELAACPWNPSNRLALVALRAAPIRTSRTPPRNLTFLLDVSGSMQPQNRLPLVKGAMSMLVDTLRPEDHVAIVVYAGASGVVLTATPGDRKRIIHEAIERLQAGGSTNGGSGIQLAYDLATENYVKGGINRVILATDGDFNVGITDRGELTRLIEARRERGIFLSVLGVGDNNLQDATMEMLADKGNGNYSYLDSIQEARRVLVAEAGATLVTVAKDVKLQVEFNPRFVAAYRLVGYENRILRKEDFNNDRKDAGEVGAGHAVTALYELVPPGQPVPGTVDPLKYQQATAPPRTVTTNTTELMNVKVRYKAPDGDTSRLIEVPVREGGARVTSNLGFAAAVAEFGMLLRRSDYRASASWDQVLSLAREHRGEDPDGYRAEFSRLVAVAQALDKRRHDTPPDLDR
jgi:Ca-activated chloride channel family protein